MYWSNKKDHFLSRIWYDWHIQDCHRRCSYIGYKASVCHWHLFCSHGMWFFLVENLFYWFLESVLVSLGRKNLNLCLIRLTQAWLWSGTHHHQSPFEQLSLISFHIAVCRHHPPGFHESPYTGSSHFHGQSSCCTSTTVQWQHNWIWWSSGVSLDQMFSIMADFWQGLRTSPFGVLTHFAGPV